MLYIEPLRKTVINSYGRESIPIKFLPYRPKLFLPRTLLGFGISTLLSQFRPIDHINSFENDGKQLKNKAIDIRKGNGLSVSEQCM